MKKLSGGLVLQCGHRQVVSLQRIAVAKAGYEQHSVWCIECDDWSRLMPIPVESETEGDS